MRVIEWFHYRADAERALSYYSLHWRGTYTLRESVGAAGPDWAVVQLIGDAP